jgi:hypothetical protein
MVGMLEVDLGVDFSLARSVEHVGDLGKRIFILFGEVVEASVKDYVNSLGARLGEVRRVRKSTEVQIERG